MTDRRAVYRAVAQSLSPTARLSHEEILQMVIPLLESNEAFTPKQIKSASKKARRHTLRSSAKSGGRAGMAYLTSKTVNHAFVKLASKRYIELNGEKTSVTSGCKSASQLKAQLRYLSQNGAVKLEYYQKEKDLVLGGSSQYITKDNIDEICKDFDLTNREHKVDQTSQFIVSFPPGTNEKLAAKTVRDWAEEMFTSEKYKTAHDYIIAIHTDKDHVHGHVIVNRAGIDIETGRREWLKISNRSPRNFVTMRQEQIDRAEKNGIMLTAPSRIERGLIGKTDKPKHRPNREHRVSKIDELAAMTAVIWHGQNLINLATILTEKNPNYDKLIHAGRKLLNGESLELPSKEATNQKYQPTNDPRKKLTQMVRIAIDHLENGTIPKPYRSRHKTPKNFQYPVTEAATTAQSAIIKSPLVERYNIDPQIIKARCEIPPAIRRITNMDQQWADDDIHHIQKMKPDFTIKDYMRLTDQMSRAFSDHNIERA